MKAESVFNYTPVRLPDASALDNIESERLLFRCAVWRAPKLISLV